MNLSLFVFRSLITDFTINSHYFLSTKENADKFRKLGKFSSNSNDITYGEEIHSYAGVDPDNIWDGLETPTKNYIS